MKVYRAWINQSSTLQPLHKYYGKKGIAIEENGIITLHFSEGTLLSMVVPKICLSKTYDYSYR